MFWEDQPPITRASGDKDRVRPLAPIPDTGWRPPRDFPNLNAARVLGFDTETYDPQLTTHGPGWSRGAGHIVGFSIATQDGHSWYFPVRHEVQTEFNMDPEAVIRFMRDAMAKPIPKVGANVLYDIGWMAEEDIKVNGLCYDVQYAEAILFDTAFDYSLDAIGRRWLGHAKKEDELYLWCAQSYGGKPNRKQAANIYRAPPCLVGPYAEVDALLPVRTLPLQWEEMRKANLLRIFDLETRLIPVLLGMRQRGIPVSRERAEEVSSILEQRELKVQLELNQEAGFEVNVHAPVDLQRLFDSKGLSYPRTKKGAPSFKKDWLAQHEHPVGKLVSNIRRYHKAHGTFVQGYILDKETNGRIYPTFHPLRGEDGGAVSGRYASSDPNAQNIPVRDKEIGNLVRSCFVPEDNMQWVKQDLSQIEYRFFAHFSGDERLIREYQDPKTDYHDVVSGFLGNLMPRKPIKNFNFMKLFGGGIDKTIAMLRAEFTRDTVNKLLLDLTGAIPAGDPFVRLAHLFTNMYETNFPAAKQSLNRDIDIANKTGEIRTILGRRSTFNLWEPINRRNKKPLSHDKALLEYGYAIKRANTYRGLNRRLQGSAADLLKMGMLKAYEEGVFDSIGFPHATVHDELDNSYHEDLRQGYIRLQNAVETAIKLRVPVMLGAEIGPNWGTLKKIDLLAA